MTKPINWHEVTMGETEIVNIKGRKFLVLCIHDGDAWLYDPQEKYHFNRTIESLKDWTIDDPWEDVSNQCHINAYGNIDHNGHIVEYNDLASGRYKRSEKGLLVWKRKEGAG